ncbi:PD-(D/E)XK nuclease family transposase [Gorillibacterium sp. sgz500922]|uniref:PD-(D/E)XK nuclease family transposase n=1 Tax=Gorillibacterium sp. sgz500922 TaxID=3446694 RepID=UPI003F665547
MELPKLDDRPSSEDGLINWLLFLKGTDPTHWKVLKMNETGLEKAMETLQYLSQDSKARLVYEARQKYLHDQASFEEGSREEKEKLREEKEKLREEKEKLREEKEKLREEKEKLREEKEKLRDKRERLRDEMETLRDKRERLRAEEERFRQERMEMSVPECVKEGLQEVAARMLSMGLALEMVAQVTGLPAEELETLR